MNENYEDEYKLLEQLTTLTPEFLRNEFPLEITERLCCSSDNFVYDDFEKYCVNCGKSFPNDDLKNVYNVSSFYIPRKKNTYNRSSMYIDSLLIFLGQVEPVLKKKKVDIYNFTQFIKANITLGTPEKLKRKMVEYIKTNKVSFLSKYLNYFLISELKTLHPEFYIKIDMRDILELQEDFDVITKNMKNIIFNKIIYKQLINKYPEKKHIFDILIIPKKI